MPAIRSWDWTYNNSTSATSIVGRLPLYQPGDLLVAICTADTGNQTWSSPGWTQLCTKTNTVNVGILWKIADTTEPDPTITYSVAETANVRILSIYDYDTTNPFGPVFYGVHPLNMTNQYNLNGTINAVGQCFSCAGDLISGCKFYLKKTGNPTGNIVARITTITGTFGTNAIPTTTILATSSPVSATTLSTDFELVDFDFPTPFAGNTNTNYFLVLEYVGTATDYVSVGYTTGLTPIRHEGNAATRTGTTWTGVGANDLIFYVKNERGFGSTLNSLMRSVCHDVIPTSDNSLVLLIDAHNATDGLTTFYQSNALLESASSGAAHSDSLFWTIAPKAGRPLPQITFAECLSASAHQMLSLTINPPPTGAQVVPAYPCLETSVYIDPVHGTTAYNGNTAMSTATTNFGSTINGATLANGTVGVTADTGLLSFHSMVRLTGPTAANTYNGAAMTLAVANRIPFQGKNLLIHLRPNLPRMYQNTHSVITSLNTKGIGFGVATTANVNYRVYHVFGSGTTWNNSTHVPLVINTDSTRGILQNTGTLETNLAVIGVFVSGFITAPIYEFGSLWLSDLTAVSGGTPSEPINLISLGKAIGAGKERMTAIIQGNSQMLLLQPVRIGNGNDFMTHFKLENTAIEFPSLYNVERLATFYNSVENYSGIEYYAGDNDSIIHTNSVISSTDKFFWRIHANSSSSATYNFKNLTIIGSGDVQLRPVTQFDQMTFIRCSPIVQNMSSMSYCSFEDSYLIANNLSAINNCDFTMKSVAGHAIEITVPGTYTLEGCVFNGYGANETATAAIYNNSGGNVTIEIVDGNLPTVRNGAGSTTTIVQAANVTLTGIQPNSEVRAYVGTNPDTAVEIAGIENTVSSVYTFSQSHFGQPGYIQIFHLDYHPVVIELTYSSTNQSIPIQQIRDRQYDYGSIP